MHTTAATFRFSAAAASVAITFALLSGIAGMAKPAASGALLAQAAATTTVR